MSHTPSRSSAVRESTRTSGSWSRQASYFRLQGAEFVDGVGPPARPGPAVLRAACEQDTLVEWGDRFLAYEGGSELYGVVCPQPVLPGEFLGPSEEPVGNGYLAKVRPVFGELLLGSASPVGVEAVSASRSREGGPHLDPADRRRSDSEGPVQQVGDRF